MIYNRCMYIIKYKRKLSPVGSHTNSLGVPQSHSWVNSFLNAQQPRVLRAIVQTMCVASAQSGIDVIRVSSEFSLRLGGYD